MRLPALFASGAALLLLAACNVVNLDRIGHASWKTVAVADALPRKIHMDYVGITAFENRVCDYDVPELDLDSLVRENVTDPVTKALPWTFIPATSLQKRIDAGEDFGVSSVYVRPPADEVCALREAGADALFVLRRDPHMAPDAPFVAGVGVYCRRSLRGTTVRVCVCIQYSVHNLRTGGISSLAFVASKPLLAPFAPAENWSDIPPGTRREIVECIRELFRTEIREQAADALSQFAPRPTFNF